MTDLLQFEREYLQKGYRYIAGVDEVGRGPLAGFVAVCAAIMDLSQIVAGVDDSKKLSEKKREFLYPLLQKSVVDYKIVMRTPQEIDDMNILRATISAMEEAVCALSPAPDIVFVDAVKLNIPYPSLSIIKGDAKSYSIAAASVLAKVTRDRLMIAMDEKYPEYGFKSNKGYGSAAHIEAIKKYGVTPEHRKSFIGNFWTGKYYGASTADAEPLSDRHGEVPARLDSASLQSMSPISGTEELIKNCDNARLRECVDLRRICEQSGNNSSEEEFIDECAASQTARLSGIENADGIQNRSKDSNLNETDSRKRNPSEEESIFAKNILQRKNFLDLGKSGAEKEFLL